MHNSKLFIMGGVTIAISVIFVLLTITGIKSIPNEEIPVLIVNFLIILSSYIILWIFGYTSKLNFVIATTLTVIFWMLLLYSAWISSIEKTGVNIGIALLVMISPPIIAIVTIMLSDKRK